MEIGKQASSCTGNDGTDLSSCLHKLICKELCASPARPSSSASGGTLLGSFVTLTSRKTSWDPKVLWHHEVHWRRDCLTIDDGHAFLLPSLIPAHSWWGQGVFVQALDCEYLIAAVGLEANAEILWLHMDLEHSATRPLSVPPRAPQGHADVLQHAWI